MTWHVAEAITYAELMPAWAKIVLRGVGMLNSAALLLGLSFLGDCAYKIVTGQIKESAGEPYFYVAFVTMATIEIAFAGVFLVASIRFVWGNLAFINMYSVSVVLYIAYFESIGFFLWPLGHGIGKSIAAATGVSSATAPFAFLLFFVHPVFFPIYPIITAVVVQLLKYIPQRARVPLERSIAT